MAAGPLRELDWGISGALVGFDVQGRDCGKDLEHRFKVTC